MLTQNNKKTAGAIDIKAKYRDRVLQFQSVYLVFHIYSKYHVFV